MMILTVPAFAVSFVVSNFSAPPASADRRSVSSGAAVLAAGAGGGVDDDELDESLLAQPAIASPMPSAPMTGIFENPCTTMPLCSQMCPAITDAGDRRFLPRTPEGIAGRRRPAF